MESSIANTKPTYWKTAQRLTSHADKHTTRLYDHRSRAVTTEIVETTNYGNNWPAAQTAQS